MSSHREAPETSKDPSIDNTDVYAFVSPDRPSTVTLIANFIPFELPNGGPNFYEFSDEVLYEIHVSNSGTSEADISYQFRFTTTIRNKNTFLYNTGPIHNIGDKTWNRPQHYTVTKVVNNRSTVIASGLSVPPVNVGKRSTPNYAHLANQAIHPVKGGRRVFAGQRADAFHVDLGSAFDLAGLRPLNQNHEIKLPVMKGMNGLRGLNVHTIALQVPIRELTRDGSRPKDVMSATSVIGVYASASRQITRVFNTTSRKYEGHGPFQQVSRLANPLFNELLVPMAEKDNWNSRPPSQDKNFKSYVAHPELAALLPILYPGAFPHLGKYKKERADLEAVFLTGIPKGVVPGFQNHTAGPLADLVRLNVAIPHTKKPNAMGLIGGDAAGFPNGRRPNDDVANIELKALAGATIPLVDKSFKADKAVALVSDGTYNDNGHVSSNFPFLGLPNGGYEEVNGHGQPR